MKIDIPTAIIQEAIDANILQEHGSLNSTEVRAQHVQRLVYQVGEYVCAKIGKDMKTRKMLPYTKHE